MTIINADNFLNEYDLAASDELGWQISLDINLLSVPANGSETTTLRVKIPNNAAPCTRNKLIVSATSRADNTITDNDSSIAHVAKAEFKLENIYALSLDSAFYIREDTRLAMRFYGYNDAFENEVLIWGGESSISNAAATILTGDVVHSYPVWIDVAPGQTFTLRYRLEWNEPAWPGGYMIHIYWDAYESRPYENFTFLYTRAYFDNGDVIENTVTYDSRPYGTGTRYLVAVTALDFNDYRDGQFNVDIVLGAYGAGGIPHRVMDNHPIMHSMGTIDVIESGIYSELVSDITVTVLEKIIFLEKFENIKHPNNNPIKKAKLVVIDNLGNVVWDNIASWITRRGDLTERKSTIKERWMHASSPEKSALISEISAIKSLWPFAPTSSAAGTIAGTGLEPAVIYHQGGNTIEVESGQTFVLRHRLHWGEPDPGIYIVGIYWDSPDNNPAENFTFLYTSAYFDNDGDNLPDPSIAMIENRVRFAEGPSPDDPTRTRYGVVVYSLEDIRNGTFNVDIWLRAAGSGANHSPTENHPIYYSGSIDVWEATTLSVSPTSPITIRVPARGVDTSISPERQSGLAGITLNYAVTVKNTGGDVDSFNLSAIDNFGWALTLSENRVENVPPGEKRTMTLSVTIPDNAPDATDNITVTATSAANPLVGASDTCAARAIEVKTAILHPSNDTNAYERYPDSNYGSSTSIWVSPYDSQKNRGFLKFDLSELPSDAWVTGAKLRLYCWKKEYDDFDAAAYEVVNDNWSENTLTWNNQPSYGGRLYTVRITGVGWYTWEVRSFIDRELKGDGVASLCIKGAVEPHGGRARFDSKEWDNSDMHPYLEITYTSPSGEWTGEWTEKADTPDVGGYGEAVVGTGSYIYIAKTLYATSTPQFWRYDPTADNWTNMSVAGLPTGAFRSGTALAWDNSNYIYALAGARYSDSNRRLFFRYSISGDNWTQMADTTSPQGAGDAITWSGHDGYVYALIGSSVHGMTFARYNSASDNWEIRASPPAGVEDGASLVWTGGVYLYALRGEYLETTPLQDFWRYDIVSDNWTTMTPIPENGGVSDGGSLLWVGNWLPSHADYIYALGGGDCWENPGDNFYRYIISANTWERLTSIPYPIGYYVGNRLGFADGHIYYWQGTPSEFYGGGRKFCVFQFPA